MKKLLPLFSLALVSAGVQAGNWTEPTLNYSTDEVPDAAYIYNVEQGKFLTKGGAWGTHAAIADASRAFLYEIQLQGQEEDGTNIYQLHCAAAANTGLLGRSTEIDLYTDTKSGAAWDITWIFVKDPVSGCYRIMTNPSATIYGMESSEGVYAAYQLGWNPNGEDLTNGNGAPMGTNEGVYMVDPTDAEGWSLDWGFVTPDDYAVYAANKTLYDELNAAEEMGYTEAELAEYAALLASTTATIDDINAAVEALKALELNYAYDHATPENPYDVTSKIVNPTFDGAVNTEAAGWVDEFGNMKIQNNKAYGGWDDETGSETTEKQFSNFVQNWTSSNTDPIAPSNIYQVINDLPQGTYILEAWCIATSGSASLEVSGCELYAESGVAHFAAEVNNPYGSEGSSLPHKYQVLITHQGGDLKIGYGFTPGYVKWFGMDNVKLYYAGPVDNPGLVALTSTYEMAKNYLDEDKYYYSQALYDALDSELETAEDLLGGGSSDDCLNEVNVISELLTQIKADVSAYTTLKTLLATMQSDTDVYTNCGMEDLADKIADLFDVYNGAYEDKKATQEQIAEWTAAYKPMIQEGIKAAMANATEESPVDITGLFDNMGFEQNTAESASPAGWTCSASAFKARANTAEVWNTSFDAYRVFENLPAGAYRLTAKALSRNGSSQENFDGHPGITAQFYAGDAAVTIADQALGAVPQMVHSNDVNVGTEESPVFLPNSMEGAHARFIAEDCPYINEVTTVIFNDGDPLRVGFRDNGVDGVVTGNSWTIWTDLRIQFLGQSNAAIFGLIEPLVQQATAMQDKVGMVAEADKKLNEAISASENVTPASSEEDLNAVIDQLKAAIEYANTSLKLIDELMVQNEVYTAKLETLESSDTKFPTMMEEIGGAISDEEFESNEQIEQWLQMLASAWTKYVQFDHLGATKEAPEDVTPVIINPNFDEGTNDTNGATGWTFDVTTGSGGHIGYNTTAQQEGSGMAFEYWKVTAFDMSQTISGLAEGYYRLSCNALYRAGNNTPEVAAAYLADPAAARAMSLYANEEKKTVASIYDCAQPEATGADGEGSTTLGESTVWIPNTMISAGAYFNDLDLYKNELFVFVKEGEPLKIGLALTGDAADNNWCVFDNFKLEYFGNGEENAPDAIQGVGTSAAQIATTRIYNVDGQQISRLQKGVNIIKTTLADGSVRVNKVLVR